MIACDQQRPTATELAPGRGSGDGEGGPDRAALTIGYLDGRTGSRTPRTYGGANAVVAPRSSPQRDPGTSVPEDLWGSRGDYLTMNRCRGPTAHGAARKNRLIEHAPEIERSHRWIATARRKPGQMHTHGEVRASCLTTPRP